MKKGTSKTKRIKAVAIGSSFVEPKFVGEANTSLLRRNRSATIEPTDKYIHLEGGVNPFFNNSGHSLVDAQRTIQLCQMSYWNVAIVRNTIEIMTELCDSRVSLVGGNSTSRKFIGAWLKNIRLESLKEQFFREYHRSGNIFLFRFDGQLDPNEGGTLTEMYGQEMADIVAGKVNQIPLRYVFLNPARIRTNNTVIFQNSQYFQMLTPIEMEKLRYPKTKEDQDLFNSLDADTKQKIKNNMIPYVPLDQKHLYPIFAKKMDYEPFAVPFVFPILEQINAHIELQRIDQALARTVDRAILLITNGAKKDEGGISPQTLAALQNLLRSESVTRTLVADYTTKGEWLIPDLSKVLGSAKYEELNRQINIGLNALFFDDNAKFATASVKTKIFIERLGAPRRRFLLFLQDEINRVCDIMNFKTYPQAVLEDIQLKDEAEFIRLFTRMTELGILTPQQFFTAVDTGKLPDISQPEYMQEIQKYTDQRDDGLFLPLVGASMQDPTGQAALGLPGAPKPTKPSGPTKSAGRPKGAKAPQTKKKISPIGASFSMLALRDNTIAATDLIEGIEAKTKKKHKIKELNDNQKHICQLMSQAIMLNETKENWNKSISSYLKSFKSPIESVLNDVEAIANEHSISSFEASLLYLSKIS